MWLHKQICCQIWMQDYKEFSLECFCFLNEIKDDLQILRGVLSEEEVLSFEKRGDGMNNYQRWGGIFFGKKKAELQDSNKGTFKICDNMNIMYTKLYDIFK